LLKRYFQFAAIPRGVRTSLPLALLLRGASPTSLHATCPFPEQMGLQDGQRTQQQHDTPPPASAPFPLQGYMLRQTGATLSRSHPRLPASPFIGVEGRLNREGGTQQQPTILIADPCSPAWPVLSETGHAPAVHTHLHLRERTSSA
jgi:hypothetical protein